MQHPLAEPALEDGSELGQGILLLGQDRAIGKVCEGGHTLNGWVIRIKAGG